MGASDLLILLVQKDFLWLEFGAWSITNSIRCFFRIVDAGKSSAIK